jgi:hypothetical protein
MFVGTLAEENFMLASFLSNSWRDEYELRVDNELVSEENWPDILRERDRGDVIIHIMTNPPGILRRSHSRPAESAYDTSSVRDGHRLYRRRSYSSRASEFTTLPPSKAIQA